MSSAQRPYQLHRIDRSDRSETEITGLVRIDKFTDVGTGETATAHVTPSSAFGKYVTKSPVLDQFDEFRLEMRDISGNVFQRIMYLESSLPQQNEDGQLVPLELYGREQQLRHVMFLGHHIRISLKLLVNRIISFYNSQKGTSQPTLALSSDSSIPDYTYGDFVFGDSVSCYDALMAVITQLNLAVPAGGAGDFYELLFSDVVPSGNLTVHILPQGTRASTVQTVRGKAQGTIRLLGIKDAVTADIVPLKGAPDRGRMPSIWQEIRDKYEEFTRFPEWDSTASYVTGVYVRYRNIVYRATAKGKNQTPGPGLFWGAVTLRDYLGGNLLSEKSWSGQQHILSYLGNIPNTTYNSSFSSPCFFDGNLAVRETDFVRTFAHHRVKSVSAVSSVYGSPGEGTRILVDSRISGSVGPPFGSGSAYNRDKRNASYKDAVVQLDDDGDWIVQHTPKKGDQCVILKHNAGVYEFQGPSGATSNNSRTRRSQVAAASQLRWVDIRNSYLGYDCIHWPSAVTAVPSLLPSQFVPSITGTNPATKIEYLIAETEDDSTFFGILLSWVLSTISPVSASLQTLLDLTVGREVYNFGWWATLFEAPSPAAASGSSRIGESYKQPVMDLYNLNKTPAGAEGYDASDAHELQPLTGIYFLFNFRIALGIAGNWPQGDIPFRVFVYDTESNVWHTDFTYRHLGETQDIQLPFSQFQIYKAREPIGLSFKTVLSNILTPEIPLLEVLEQRRVKMITIQCMLSYDEHGRYAPFNFDSFAKGFVSNLAGVTVKTAGIIDAFSFTKAPFALAKSAHVSARHRAAKPKEYQITNTEQLKKIAQAELDLAQHRLESYTIEVTGRCDIKAGDSIFLQDADHISTSEATGTDNTRKLAVRKISQKINAQDSKRGGHTTEISVYRKINAV